MWLLLISPNIAGFRVYPSTARKTWLYWGVHLHRCCSLATSVSLVDLKEVVVVFSLRSVGLHAGVWGALDQVAALRLHRFDLHCFRAMGSSTPRPGRGFCPLDSKIHPSSDRGGDVCRDRMLGPRPLGSKMVMGWTRGANGGMQTRQLGLQSNSMEGCHMEV